MHAGQMHECRCSGVRKTQNFSRQNMRRIALAFNIETHGSEQCSDIYHPLKANVPEHCSGV